MSESTPTESTGEMRLVDHAVFKEVIGNHHRGTGEASNRVERLRDALQHLKVERGSLESEDQLNDLRNGIITVYRLDALNYDESWCEHGFRHRLSDGQYRWNSTITVLSQTYNLRFEERKQHPNSAWDVNKALWSLMPQLEAAAELIDRMCHISGGSEPPSDQAQFYAYAWAADILTNVQLETSLKTLWVLRNPKGDPKKELGHHFRKMWDALQDDQDSVMDYVSALPIMFKRLSPRKAVEDSGRWAFDTMPDDEWVESRYWHTSDWGKHRVSMPFFKFWITLGVFCVAQKASVGQL